MFSRNSLKIVPDLQQHQDKRNVKDQLVWEDCSEILVKMTTQILLSVLTLIILTGDVVLVEADAGSWLSWSWSQAQTAGKEAGSALYKGNHLQFRKKSENIFINL